MPAPFDTSPIDALARECVAAADELRRRSDDARGRADAMKWHGGRGVDEHRATMSGWNGDVRRDADEFAEVAAVLRRHSAWIHEREAHLRDLEHRILAWIRAHPIRIDLPGNLDARLLPRLPASLSDDWESVAHHLPRARDRVLMRIEIDPDDLDRTAGGYRDAARQIDDVRGALAGRRGQTVLDGRDLGAVRAAPLDRCRQIEDHLGSRSDLLRREASRLDSTAARFRGIESEAWGFGVGAPAGSAWSALGLSALGIGGAAVGASAWLAGGAVVAGVGAAAGALQKLMSQAGRGIAVVGRSVAAGPFALLIAGGSVAGTVASWLAAHGRTFGSAAWSAITGGASAALSGLRSFVEGCVQRCASSLRSTQQTFTTVGRWVADAGHSAVSTWTSVRHSVVDPASRALQGFDWRDVTAGVLVTALLPISTMLSKAVVTTGGEKLSPWPFQVPKPIENLYDAFDKVKSLKEAFPRWDNQYGWGFAAKTTKAVEHDLDLLMRKGKFAFGHKVIGALGGSFLSAIDLRSALYGSDKNVAERVASFVSSGIGLVDGSAQIAGLGARAAGTGSAGFSGISTSLGQVGILATLVQLNVEGYSHIGQSQESIDRALLKAGDSNFERLQDYQRLYGTSSALTPAAGHHAEFDAITSVNYLNSGWENIKASASQSTLGGAVSVAGTGLVFGGVGVAKGGVAAAEWAAEETKRKATGLVHGVGSALSGGWHAVAGGGGGW